MMAMVRDDELSDRKRIRERLLEIYKEIEEGFIAQRERTDDQIDYWDIYNCKLGSNQYYQGNSRIFVPIVHNAINARKTRFTNQIFPRAGRCVEVIDEDGEQPAALMALAEHYVRKAKLRTKVAPTLNKYGDVEGQYNVYVSWRRTRRDVVWAETRPVEIDGMAVPDAEEIEDIHEETVWDEGPEVEVLPDADVLIHPATAAGVEEALALGGHVTVLRRWSRGRLREMIDGGEIAGDTGETLMKGMRKVESSGRTDTRKELVDAAGIKDKGKYYLGYETWTRLKVDGVLKLCRVYFGGGDEKILGAKRNPYWCDKCPLLSVPVDNLGIAKGQSLVMPCAQMQYGANDAINEGMDSATYALLPIIMTDPEKNPRVGSMILDLAAVWETNPKDTQFASFPPLWRDAFQIVAASKSEVFETLGVNPSMVPQQSGKPGSKRNQAEVAMEQQVDILTTSDVVTVQEEGIWTPLIERFMEYDAQFRTTEVTIRAFGSMGVRAKMEQVPPVQMGKRYEFRWFGIEQARNAAQIQQQIAAINVVRGVPPQLYKGYELSLVVPMERLVMSAFGPRDAPLIFKDVKSQLSIDPEIENGMLADGFEVRVSPFDNDAGHLPSHLEAMKEGGDPTGAYRVHILMHQMSMAQKAQAAAQPPGQPGMPGGAGPGTPGQSPPGAQPQGPQVNRGPPGMIPADRMPAAGAVGMPRRT
jgi:hypothetical protein